MKYYCTLCGETMDTETCWKEHGVETITPFDEIEEMTEEDEYLKTITPNNTEHESGLCEHCHGHHFYDPYCYITGQMWDDFHPGLTEAEEMWNDGICPICDEYNGLKADAVIAEREGREPTGTMCGGHGIAEWREYHEQQQGSS